MPDTFGLLFQAESADPKPAMGASAQVYLCFSNQGRCLNPEDRIFLSRQCLTVHELRREIDRLQKELEYLWHIGRRSFSDFEELKKSQLAQAAS
jgi:hypothetical protein